MSEVPKETEVLLLSQEVIEQHTGFRLAFTLLGFSLNGSISPEIREQYEAFGEEQGEDKVIPSFFMDGHGVVQVGLFIKPEDMQQ